MKNEQQIRDYLAELKEWYKLMDGADRDFKLVEGIIEGLEFVLDRTNEQPEPKPVMEKCTACNGNGYLTDVHQYNADGILESKVGIERCDTCMVFESDKEAKDYLKI